MKRLFLHAPSIVCAFWAVVFAATGNDEDTIPLALTTIAASIVVHTCEVVRMHRRRR